MKWPSYHLWIKPPEAERACFAESIARLASELGGPVFEPHVTLSDGVEGAEADLVRAAESLARELSAFELALTRVAVGTEYFRCIYVEAELTRPLARARALARRTFAQPSAAFMPHLSLAYGTFEPARKAAAVASLPAAVMKGFRADQLSLIRAETEDPARWREICAPRLGATA